MKDWDKHYREQKENEEQPHPLLTEFAAGLKPGRALDVASGAGRHAIWLAERGWQVTAVDYSPAAMQLLQKRCLEKSLHIDTVVADLEQHEFTIEPESYDLIVVFKYLQRDLFPSIRKGVRIGGVVIALIPMATDDPNIKPMNPAYLVDHDELKGEFEGWELLRYFEGSRAGRDHSRPAAELVARRQR